MITPSVIAQHQGLVPGHPQPSARGLEDDWVGLLDPDLRADDDRVKQLRQLHLVQDLAQPRVKVADHRQLEACMGMEWSRGQGSGVTMMQIFKVSEGPLR